MKAIHRMVWEVFEMEAEDETYSSPKLFVDEVAAIVWNWNGDELRAAGIDPRFVLATSRAAFDEIEATGWSEVRQRLRRRVQRRERAQGRAA